MKETRIKEGRRKGRTRPAVVESNRRSRPTAPPHPPDNRSPEPAVAIPNLAAGRAAVWVVLALIAINLIIYAPVRHFEFVSWDDPQYITDNPHISAEFNWQTIRWAFTTGYQFYWHPLTWLSYLLDARIYGLGAGGFHTTNVLLHIANTILLFGILYRMTRALGKSTFVAAMFAAHPLRVESVAWIAER